MGSSLLNKEFDRKPRIVCSDFLLDTYCCKEDRTLNLKEQLGEHFTVVKQSSLRTSSQGCLSTIKGVVLESPLAINKILLDKLPDVRVLTCYQTGASQVSEEMKSYLMRRRIKFWCPGTDLRSQGIAEFALSSMLAVSHKLMNGNNIIILNLINFHAYFFTNQRDTFILIIGLAALTPSPIVRENVVLCVELIILHFYDINEME